MLHAILFIAALLIVLLFLLLEPIWKHALRHAKNRVKQRFIAWQLQLLAMSTQAMMVAGSAINVLDRPGGFHFALNFTLDPGNILAGGREVETVAVPGAVVGDVVALSPRYATSLIVGYTRVSAAGVITFSLENNTAGALDEGANIWDCVILRGTTGPLR